MNCWTILGLRADADERAIKRSYSALLKAHRPDEDLDAFQRLRGAYEQALMFARLRAEEQDDDDSPVFATADLGQVGDAGLVAELERPKTLADEAEVAQAQMLDRLGDLAPPSLDVIAAQAKADGRLALFERCLLERCLNDSEQGYSAAQWALARLGWLTPWQEVSLPSLQLDGLANRLLATELHGLHDLLAEGDEQAFLERVAVLHEQGWLQPFDLRAHFNRQLVDILLAVAQWSQPFFKALCARCGWDELQANQAGWLREWDLLLRRGELEGLEERLHARMALRRPDTAQARAAWLLLKPLKAGRRRRLVDRFTEADWRACEMLEDSLTKEAPEVLPRMAPDGLLDWRKWRDGPDWRRTEVFLMLLMFVPCWLSLSEIVINHDPILVLFSLAGAVMSAVMANLGLYFLHHFWRPVAHLLAGLDVALSSLLLPRDRVSEGRGFLLLRHGIPCAAVMGTAVLIGGLKGPFSAVAVGVLSAVLTLAYVDFAFRVGSPWGVLRRFLGRFGRLWRMLKLGFCGAIVLTGTALAAWHFKDVLPPQFKKPLCTMALVFDGKCEVP